MKTKLIISSGQYETQAIAITVNHKTEEGLMKRARQLSRDYAVYGDNWAGLLNANIAIADPENDVWGNNKIIGGKWCEPANGWLEL